ncbi:DUF721 domain-containing protein [Shewanella sp. SR43-4]|jgi:hypothetical protein|uniref:DciA family protein n=1 Tax=Shewanella vesiculosa TaxID=518738 RepID=A0ABV0FTE0_9GAMM|nr:MULTISPECIES: DciA family protein [Shewanella]NCQ46837.1 DUF721 domain-containing protein [Shewanella frigidimarina]MBB1319639.1 DUF721 domain-containing protein [Shewanella sp. SR43-4]MBB1322650.1 DUF721 domain-containing protein [Shewanella sp. SR43-8]MBB1390387.1 DUF721 domain-containing protein [Shewanella sp. SG44-6]NCO73122.1 DUF721 domain-containing protein [Shewanella vesiculosa]|tara:strand:+ start:3938 stop:4390 length:453 start_codon:yes stop_codon:yes gene_type:complete
MKKPPQDLSNLVHLSGRLPELAEKAELLNNLNRYVKQTLSGPVAEQLKVANLRQGVLVIETTSAAWAARINFQKQKLLKQLQTDTLPMLTAIEVKVNPGLALAKPQSQTNQNVISTTAAQHIEALAEHVDGSLGEKLKRLAALASRNRQS